MRFFKIPKIITILFPKYIWKLPNAEKKIYLTFDDGPIPEVTEWVLDVLKQENIKASFFCIGDNIKKNPLIFKRIITEKHAVGNHTFNHLKGWKTAPKNYIENVQLCEEEILRHTNLKSKLFRPPYGKIRRVQANAIQKLGYKIIMWDVLSYDFDADLNEEKCLQKVIKNASKGSIIVFHDSIKANNNLKFALPKAIQLLKKKGFVFDKLN
uniref:polysaccharide deacetylase family protein n=1 Tax=Flavobacterium sp. TaxID=239 RepID=UPI00404B4646